MAFRGPSHMDCGYFYAPYLSLDGDIPDDIAVEPAAKLRPVDLMEWILEWWMES